MTPLLVAPPLTEQVPIRFTFVDHFCGAGGSSIGLREAGGDLKLAANHWERAIETHSYNFPDADHLIADLSGYDMRKMPRADVLWTSPECTWHSPAGGRKRVRAELDLFDDYVPDAAGDRSRMTMFDVIRAAETGKFKIIIVENVVEVVAWPLFKNWLGMLEALGLQWQMMCVSSAHIGGEGNPYAPQWRDRIYFVFYKKGIPMPDIQPHPLAWCDVCEGVVESTQRWKRHDRMPTGKYGQQYEYVCSSKSHPSRVVEPYVLPAAAAIDWSDLGTPLGERKRPLKPATMRRIEMGIRMFWHPVVVADHGNTWDAASPGHPGEGREDAYYRANPADGAPLAARSATPGDGVAVPFMFEGREYRGDDAKRLHGLEEPLTTVTATGRGAHNIINPPFLAPTNHGAKGDGREFDPDTQPLPTRTSKGSEGLIVPGQTERPTFIDVARANNRPRGVDEPLAPVTTGQNQGVVSDPFIAELWGTSTARSVDEPISTISAGGNHHGLTLPEGAFISRAYGSRGHESRHLNTSPMTPLHPITASGGGNHALVIPYRRGKPTRADRSPLPTQTTTRTTGLLSLEELGVDMDKVKFRILGPREHLNAQRFPADYVVMGNKGEQTMQAGNAVSSNVAHYLGQKVAVALA